MWCRRRVYSLGPTFKDSVKKCVRIMTLHSNEGFNNLIWKHWEERLYLYLWCKLRHFLCPKVQCGNIGFESDSLMVYVKWRDIMQSATLWKFCRISRLTRKNYENTRKHDVDITTCHHGGTVQGTIQRLILTSCSCFAGCIFISYEICFLYACTVWWPVTYTSFSWWFFFTLLHHLSTTSVIILAKWK